MKSWRVLSLQTPRVGAGSAPNFGCGVCWCVLLGQGKGERRLKSCADAGGGGGVVMALFKGLRERSGDPPSTFCLSSPGPGRVRAAGGPRW